MLDDDSLTEAFDADGPNMDEFYQRVVSLDEVDFVDSDDGSVTDLDRTLRMKRIMVIRMMGPWRILRGTLEVEACSFAFQNALGAFPPEAADIRPAVVFRNRLFSGEELANAVVSVRGDVPMPPVLQVMDNGAALIPRVTHRPVQRTVSGSVGWDIKTDEVSVVSWPMCVRRFANMLRIRP